MDGHDEANSRFSPFCEKRLNILYYQNKMTSLTSQIQRCKTILHRQQFAQREMDCMSKGKGKQSHYRPGGPEVLRRLRLPDFKTIGT